MLGKDFSNILWRLVDGFEVLPGERVFDRKPREEPALARDRVVLRSCPGVFYSHTT